MSRPDWNNYFLEIAEVVSRRSTCLRRHYGSLVVRPDMTIAATGYNGNPRKEPNCCDVGYCEREKHNIQKGKNYEMCRAIHSEQNCLLACDPASLKGATIYIVGIEVSDGSYADGTPCKMCSRFIKNAQIAKVVYRTKDGSIKEIGAQNLDTSVEGV